MVMKTNRSQLADELALLLGIRADLLSRGLTKAAATYDAPIALMQSGRRAVQ